MLTFEPKFEGSNLPTIGTWKYGEKVSYEENEALWIRSLALYDKHLTIIKNFLRTNTPAYSFCYLSSHSDGWIRTLKLKFKS